MLMSISRKIIILTFLRVMCKFRVTFSSITEHTVFGRKIFLKRDDLLRVAVANEVTPLSGNKARKLKFLCLEDSSTKRRPFPKYVASFGGVQSNSMVAIAKCCHKRAKFFYFVKRIPPFLKKNPIGNFDIALDLGVNMIQVAPTVYNELVNIQIPLRERSSQLFLKKLCGLKDVDVDSASDFLWVPQGAAMPEAEEGVADLASEILGFITNSSDVKSPWKVVFASGTGATAYLCARRLHQLAEEWAQSTTATTTATTITTTAAAAADRNLYPSIEVIALPCATSAQELQMQIEKLAMQCQHDPTIISKVLRILDPSGNPLKEKKDDSIPVGEGEGEGNGEDEPPLLPFAEPSAYHLRIWKSLCADTGVEFDLVYTPRAFEILLNHVDRNLQRGDSDEEKFGLCELFPDAKIIYYHCGGVEGNPSQMARYKFKGLLS